MSPRDHDISTAESTPGRRRKASSRSQRAPQPEDTTPRPPPPATSNGRLGRLAMCAVGICVCYLYYGVLQERLFTGKERPGATFVLVTQCCTNLLVALLWQFLRSKTTPNDTKPLPLHTKLLILTSGCYVIAMVASNEAVQYVSYPVAVLAKSCKLVPVMLVGQLVEGKLYSRQEWFAALSISVGIVVFHFSRMQSSTSSRSNNSYGMMLLAGSLVMDGLLTCCQNALKRPQANVHRKPSATDTMLFVNLYALLFLVPLCIFNQQWQHGLRILFPREKDGMSMASSILILNITVAIGQIFIFLSLTWFSSITTTTITTTRKFFTILVSVLSFGHSFTTTQWVAVIIVFVGLYISIGVHATAPKAKTD